jgi:hypothetical protein
MARSLGRFPTKHDLGSLNRTDLLYSIRRFGRVSKLATEIGLPTMRKLPGYWTAERVISELRPICKKYGHFPSKGEIRNEGKALLARQVEKFERGFLENELGCKSAWRPDGYWNTETLLAELRPIYAKLGRLPCQHEIKERGIRGLQSAIRKFGGSFAVAKKLGLEPPQRRMDWWTMDRIIDALLPVAEGIGRFPTHQELWREGAGAVCKPIALAGGQIKVALEIQERIRQRKLPAKWAFASRLNLPQFNVLSREERAALMESDTNYYRRLLRNQG